LAKMDMVKNCIPVVGGRLFQSTWVSTPEVSFKLKG
jgi:hypothetical protein